MRSDGEGIFSDNSPLTFSRALNPPGLNFPPSQMAVITQPGQGWRQNLTAHSEIGAPRNYLGLLQKHKYFTSNGFHLKQGNFSLITWTVSWVIFRIR